MNPSLYDLFDVNPAATADEIRKAWRAKIADLDPTDARFGRLNDAAGVLLNPERRAAYDASLAPAPAPESRVSTVAELGPEILPRHELRHALTSSVTPAGRALFCRCRRSYCWTRADLSFRV